MERGDKVKIKNTIFKLLEGRSEFKGTINSVFTKCEVIESSEEYYQRRIGQVCKMNLDWAEKI